MKCPWDLKGTIQLNVQYVIIIIMTNGKETDMEDERYEREWRERGGGRYSEKESGREIRTPYCILSFIHTLVPIPLSKHL